MIRLSLSACFVSLVVWSAAAQSLVPKPGFTEKRERVLCGRMGCEAKTFYARPSTLLDKLLAMLKAIGGSKNYAK